MKFLLSTMGVAIIFSAFQIFIFGMISWFQKNSSNLWYDLWWFWWWGLPLSAANWAAMQGWRLGVNAGMKMWMIYLLSLGASVIGTTIALYIYYRELPTMGNLAALTFIVAGMIIAVLTRS